MSTQQKEKVRDTGRPRLEIDWAEVVHMLKAGCTGAEIAGYFGIKPDTLYNKVEKEYGETFSAFRQRNIAKGDALLKVTQFYKALGLTKDGDNTQLIWLGKIRLGQKENHEITFTNATEKILNIIEDNKQPIE